MLGSDSGRSKNIQTRCKVTKKHELIKAAEHRVRKGGYANFSFRDLANDVGIKSASVHYHFATKEDLGAELARQYTDSFLASLGEPILLIKNAQNPIAHFVDHFRQALTKDKKMCLCGLLGAESDCLPDKVKYETKRFFELNLRWLETAYLAQSETETEAASKAMQTMSVLEGAMMISKCLDDNSLFERAIESMS